MVSSSRQFICEEDDLRIEITEVRKEAPVRTARVMIVLAAARLLRVPIKIRDEFRGASVGSVSPSGSS